MAVDNLREFEKNYKITLAIKLTAWICINQLITNYEFNFNFLIINKPN